MDDLSGADQIDLGLARADDRVHMGRLMIVGEDHEAHSMRTVNRDHDLSNPDGFFKMMMAPLFGIAVTSC